MIRRNEVMGRGYKVMERKNEVVGRRMRQWGG